MYVMMKRNIYVLVNTTHTVMYVTIVGLFRIMLETLYCTIFKHTILVINN